MKKWLDDLYAILLKRGFNTLDNVLKKYKTEIEDYEEIKINDELITLNPGATLEFDLLSYYNRYDRFMFYNRGCMNEYNIVVNLYKDEENRITSYYNFFVPSTTLAVYLRDNRYLSVRNRTSDVIMQFDFYVKKIC